MKKNVCFLILLILLISTIPNQVQAATENVRISLPAFKVSLNGVQVDNSYREYPLIVYKDITYFPATFYDSRFLGIETKWDAKSGLFINQTEISGGFRENKIKNRNASVYTAKIAPFAVKVNEKSIDNSKEAYPLLIFRDVTYFPMTWRFAREEFGWDYKFDNASGLDIKSDNPVPVRQPVSKYDGKNFIAHKNHIYYSGENYVIYQAPAITPQNSKNIYQLPLWSYGDGKTYVWPSLSKDEEGVWLTYHQGGAVMGRDEYIRLTENGEHEIVESAYVTFKKFGDITVRISQGAAPGANNLSIKYNDGDYRPFGDPDYVYGWDWQQTDTSAGGSPSRDLYMNDSFIYLLAFDMKNDTDSSRIHKVNINTNETSRVSNLTAPYFRMDDSTLYFVNEKNLYSLRIDSDMETPMKTSGPVNPEFEIEVLNGVVYYVSEINNHLYNTANEQSPNPGGRVRGVKHEEGYMIITFEEDKNNPYNLMVFDENAKVVFKTADATEINTISISKDTLYYTENSGKNIYASELK